MNATSLLLAGLGLGGGAAIAAAVAPARVRVPVAAVMTTAACASAFLAAGWVLVAGRTIEFASDRVLPLTGVVLSLDPLGAVFVAITAVVGVAASWYAIGYAAHGGRSRLSAALLPAFITSLLAVPAAASVATFLIAWELMALSSLLLLLTDHRKRSEARAAAQWYATMTHIGAAAIMLAFVLLAAGSGGQTFAVIRSHPGAVPLAVRSIAFVLALVGFASKAGAVPVHVWLPRAHPEAPSPVSALMSGAMVNLGVYGIIRVGADLLHGASPHGGELWWWLSVAAVGVISALFGALHASASSDLKRLLAYSTVDNVGLVLIGVGASGALAVTGHRVPAALAMVAALFHLLNHSVFKGCLFLGAGSVQYATGTRDLDQLGGLVHRLPVTAALFGIGALSISALPPFNGFASEWLLLQGFLRGFSAHGAAISIALLAGVATIALTGGLTAAAFVKALGIGFLGQPRTPAVAAAREVGATMMAGTGFLAAACVVLGVAPGLVIPMLSQAAGTALGWAQPAAFRNAIGLELARTTDVIDPALLALALAGGLVLAAIVVRSRPAARPRRAEAWGCGGEPQTARMEYTATSFAEPLQRVFVDVLRPSRDLDVSHLAESRYFTREMTYRSQIDDAVERDWYRPVIRLVSRWGDLARLVQNGSLHRYLAFGFAALVAVLVALA